MRRNRDWEKRNPEKVKEMKRRDYLHHSDAYKARAQKRYKRLCNNQEFKKEKATYLKQWRKLNWKYFVADACKRQREARRKNPKHYRAKDARKYQRQKADPTRWAQRLITSNINVHRHRARKAKARGTHTAEQWFARVALYGWRCAYCWVPLTMSTLTKDHIIPTSRGGSNWAANLAPACKSCNAAKGNRR